ncbi:MAG: Asp-tRNA(Asn)/Glu-tRNA(Gln) amidotransferase A subunit family amidase [Candidatus Paceibacteria bacterium]|jgi:Asp-tRNA(Asn)/Glu-tRNA(Gln) amidotransferase A subunit family amidase
MNLLRVPSHLLLILFVISPYSLAQEATPSPGAAEIQASARVIGAEFSDEQVDLMLGQVRQNLRSYERLRSIPLDNSVVPALYFLPLGEAPLVAEATRGIEHGSLSFQRLAGESTVKRPEALEELAFASIPELSSLIHSRSVSCVELSEMFLARLARLDETLHCVIEMTGDRALAQAKLLDQELEQGNSRGILHGIPWVAKDLLAVRGTHTTWGAEPFKGQVIETDASVARLLEEQGAVLIAKVTLGALAWGDVWFGGMTRNPWNPEQGSSGSSAGPASAVAAGGAPFGIGSETLGSIISPSTRCGNSSLRPTFGRVSRHGAMTLSWSMDKLGPICRSATDCAIVLDAIHGRDELDPTTSTRAFDPAPKEREGEGFTVGFLEGAFDRGGEPNRYAHVLEELEAMGAELVPFSMPDYPTGDMTFILSAEAATAFDEFSASGRADGMVRQTGDAWPNVFRLARLIPAVDYLRANRLRTLLTQELEAALSDLDAVVHPSFAGGVLSATNLSGHPTFVAPCGFNEDGTPFSISFTAKLFGETSLLQLARRWQASTAHHLAHPDL